MAEASGGFIHRSRLLEEGARPSLITSWIRYGRLTCAWENVYAVGAMPTDPAVRAFGAVLAAGWGAGLASWSAAAFYGAVKRWPEPVELIAPHRVRIRGLAVRQSSQLGSRDIWRFDGLAVTSPARTALDLAARIDDDDRLKALVDHLRLRWNLHLRDLQDIILRNPRHPGAARLRAMIGQATGRPTRSGVERRLWQRFAREQGIPPHEQNVMLTGVEVDVLIGEGLAIVEIDTMGSHLLKFDSDRLRDAEILARTGIPVIRITDTQMKRIPERTAANIIKVVDDRRAQRRQRG